jgi:hypothetical protein
MDRARSRISPAGPPGFKAAMRAKLARYMCKAVTGQTGMVDRMDALYRDALADAKRQDGLATGRVQRNATFRSNWLGARNRRWGG